jgi:hypothetical protein
MRDMMDASLTPRAEFSRQFADFLNPTKAT